MLRFWVLLIYLTEIKLCKKLVLYFVSEAALTHAGQLCSQMLETLWIKWKWVEKKFYYSYLPEQIPLSSRQHDAFLLF